MKESQSLRNPERVERMRDSMSSMMRWNQVGNFAAECQKDDYRVYGWHWNLVYVAGTVVDPRIVEAGEKHTAESFDADFAEFERLAYEATAEL